MNVQMSLNHYQTVYVYMEIVLAIQHSNVMISKSILSLQSLDFRIQRRQKLKTLTNTVEEDGDDEKGEYVAT